MRQDSPERLAAPRDSTSLADAGVRPAPPAAGRDAAPASIDARLVRYLLESLGDPPVRVSLWNGESVSPGSGPGVAYVRIANRASLLKLLADPAFQFGECFCDGSIEAIKKGGNCFPSDIYPDSWNTDIYHPEVGLGLDAALGK